MADRNEKRDKFSEKRPVKKDLVPAALSQIRQMARELYHYKQELESQFAKQDDLRDEVRQLKKELYSKMGEIDYLKKKLHSFIESSRVIEAGPYRNNANGFHSTIVGKIPESDVE